MCIAVGAPAEVPMEYLLAARKNESGAGSIFSLNAPIISDV